MEAMACGRTVARRNAPGVTKLLNGEEQAGGAVVPRENPKILAQALSLRFNQEGFCDGHKAHRKTPRVRPLHPLRQPF